MPLISTQGHRVSVSDACEICGTSIRYVHYLDNEEHLSNVAVGCICAGHLENNIEAAKDREKTLQNKARRRVSWMRRTWKISRQENEYLKVDGYIIVVFPRLNGWSGVVTKDDFKRFLDRNYATCEEAKAALFDLFWAARENEKEPPI